MCALDGLGCLFPVFPKSQFHIGEKSRALPMEHGIKGDPQIFRFEIRFVVVLDDKFVFESSAWIVDDASILL